MPENKERRLVTIAEALQTIPMSRAGLYQAVKRGDVPVVCIGRRKFITSDYLNGLLTTNR